MDRETIAAIATPAGRGGIGVIRVSGEKAADVCRAVAGRLPGDHRAVLLKFKNGRGDILDEGITLYFKSPRSYTGEDVVEFQCHGGPVVMDMLLREILRLPGVRQAEPGEFTKTAFLNGKIDLTRAEAITDLINASSERAALSASRSLQGVFARKIEAVNAKLTRLRTYVEAAIDFPDESIDFVGDGKVEEGIREIAGDLGNLLAEAKQGVILREGIKLVIAGRPNAGKSSLLNALCGSDLAIVTSVEGTTRDAIHENIDIDGLPLHIVDTAGLRSHTSDIVEQIGIDRAWNEIKGADRILFVYDVSKTDDPEQLRLFREIREKTADALPFTVVCNKTDLAGAYTLPGELGRYPRVAICAKTSAGVAELREHLKKSAEYSNTAEGVFSARRRHLDSLEKALDSLGKALGLMNEASAFELCAEELRNAHDRLGDILGRFTADDLLGEIFGTFCVGK